MKSLLYNMTRLDHLVIGAVNTWSQNRNFINKLFYWISKTGDGFLYPIIAVIFITFNQVQGLLFLKVGLVAYSIELPLYFALKNSIKRERPFNLLSQITKQVSPSDKFGFPSGHASAVFLFATLISLHFPSLATLTYLWAVLVGSSRVYLGVHFPTDILAGTALGTISAFIGYIIIV